MPLPNWLAKPQHDADGKSHRIAVAMSEQALHDHAAKHGRQIEQIYTVERVRNHRMGSVVKRKTTTVFYGLLSA